MPKSFLLVVLSLFVCAGAFADSVDTIEPKSVFVGDVEQYVTLSGTGLKGGTATTVTFAGRAAQVTLEPNIISPDGTSLIVWMPVIVAVNAGDYSVTVNAYDSTGVRHIGPTTISVVERPVEQPPLISLPEVVNAEATSREGAIVSYRASGTSFVQPAPELSCDHASGSLFPMGSTLVRCTATDSLGSASGAFIVSVTDTVAPVLTVPADIRSDNPVVTFTVTAHDAIDGDLTASCSPASGSTFPSGTTKVRCSVQDDSLNLATATFKITIGTPENPPVLSLPADITAEATTVNGANVSYSASSDTGTVVCSPMSGSLFPFGKTAVQCTATTPSGLSTSGSFNVTVADTTKPTLSLPADITTEATSAAGAVVTFTASATDTVDGTLTATCTPASGATFSVATTAVQCTATDLHGNRATGSFNVTVRDTTAPVLSLPADMTVEATGANGAVVTFIASSTDIVDGNVAVSCTPASGATFALGSTLVQCSATDLHSNRANGTFLVNVRDTTAPLIVKITASETYLWPPSHTMVPVTFTVAATDAVDANPVSRVISIRSNEAANGVGDGNTSPDYAITGPLSVNLRSERSGNNDRIYTITFETKDASGNATTGTYEVHVGPPPTTRPRAVR